MDSVGSFSFHKSIELFDRFVSTGTLINIELAVVAHAVLFCASDYEYSQSCVVYSSSMAAGWAANGFIPWHLFTFLSWVSQKKH